jgi:hypothetical protein
VYTTDEPAGDHFGLKFPPDDPPPPLLADDEEDGDEYEEGYAAE